MNLQEFTPDFVPGARIKVIGVGWGWANTINRMIQEGMEWIEFIAVNTDAQALSSSFADKKVNIWLNITRWLWAGANPETGRKAAEENIEELKKMLQDTDMVFVTAWMWWWTWTWWAPVIAQAAKEMWILTVWVVTKPFSFEWKKRFDNSIDWLEKIKQSVDTLIVIPNDKIFNIIDKKTTFKQAFSMVDKILLLGVQWISDLIIKPGDINIDFADIRVIMEWSWTALLGIWYWEWENRAVDAARRAIDNPLLEANLEWAQNIIFAVTGGEDLTPMEVQDSARVIEEIANPEANIIWWMTLDESFEWEVKVTIVATGFPETTQDSMIRWVQSKSVWNTRTKWQDFVSKAIGSSSWSKAKSSGQWEKTENWKSSWDEVDYDTPAFLRKKLNK